MEKTGPACPYTGFQSPGRRQILFLVCGDAAWYARIDIGLKERYKIWVAAPLSPLQSVYALKCSSTSGLLNGVEKKELLKAAEQLTDPKEKEAFIRLLMGMSSAKAEGRAKQQQKRRNLLVLILGIFFLLLVFAYIQLKSMTWIILSSNR